MRTTLSIDDSLLKQAKREALRNNRSVSAEIEEALRMSLAIRKKAKRFTPTPALKTFRGSGIQPGVDLHSNQGLANLMDRA